MKPCGLYEAGQGEPPQVEKGGKPPAHYGRFVSAPVTAARPAGL